VRERKLGGLGTDRKTSLLRDRPAKGVRSSAPKRYGCRMQLITAYNCGTISSSRCQTTCIARSKIYAIQIQVHGRVHFGVRDGAGFPIDHPSAPSFLKLGGARRDRTDDLLLAKQALSQLSYGPVEGTLEKLVGLGRLELPTSRLSSARSNQLSYKPKTIKVIKKTTIKVIRPPDLHPEWIKSGAGSSMKEREMKTAVSRQWT
jgi:hypothetical protein